MSESPSIVEHNVILVVSWVKLAIEVLGATLVTIGVCVAVVHLIRTLATRQTEDFAPTRLILARYLSLALEFQLGADILGTAVSPSWDQLGKLAAVAVIRTGLNYFLVVEVEVQAPPSRIMGVETVSPAKRVLQKIQKLREELGGTEHLKAVNTSVFFLAEASRMNLCVPLGDRRMSP